MRKTAMFSLVALLAALPLAAQSMDDSSDRGSGPTPVGSAGAEWQTEQRIQLEAMKDLERRLAELSEEEWKETALAWAAFEQSGSNAVTVSSAVHVAGFEPSKGLEVAGGPEADGWDLSYSGKAPRELTLTLTDPNRTRVECDLRPTLKKMERGMFGIFLQSGSLLCMPRSG